MNQSVTFCLIAGFTITLAVITLAACMCETKTERAQQYPAGSSERRTLEGRPG